MNLRQLAVRLLGAFTLISAALAVVTIFATYRMLVNSNEVTDSFARVQLSEELQIHLLSSNREWFLFELTGDRQHEREMLDEAARSRSTLVELKRLVDTPT